MAAITENATGVHDTQLWKLGRQS